MEHKITTKGILEAAKKCGAAKDVLRVLFPDAFEEELDFEIYHLPQANKFNIRVRGEHKIVIDGSKMPKELIIKKDYIKDWNEAYTEDLHIYFKDKE